MRNFSFLLVLFVLGCSQSNTSSDPGTNVSSGDTTAKIDTNNSTKETTQVDSLALLLEELKKVPLESNKWKIVGELKTAELKYKDVYFGDLYHLMFVDDKKNEYDFNGNVTKIALDKTATDENDEDGIEPNKKYLNKKFRVVWRHLKLIGKPQDEMEMYYEEYDQIIYLKQL